jgi:hypothetical protein
MYQNWTLPEDRDSDMAAVDTFDYPDTMARDKVGQMVLDTCNIAGSRVRCQLMQYRSLLLLYTQPATHETNISHSSLPRT